MTVRNPAGTGSLSGVTFISSGNLYTCALLADTSARCWGNNFYGQLGIGSKVNRPLPTTVRRGT